MKSCCDISKKRNGHIHSNVFEVWKITFAKKSNPNGYIRQSHASQLHVSDDSVSDFYRQ